MNSQELRIMKHRSIFPALVFVFALVMVLAHLGKSSHPEKNISRWVNASRSVEQEPEVQAAFKKVTDTLLSSGFRISYSLQQESPGAQKMRTVLKGALHAQKVAVYDSIVEVSYRDRVLINPTLLRSLILKSDTEKEFWNFAGLEWFDIDMINSTEEALVCRFSYRNSLSTEHRDFVLMVDRYGKTRMEEV